MKILNIQDSVSSFNYNFSKLGEVLHLWKGNLCDFENEVQNADIIIIRLGVLCDKNFFKRAKNLKILATVTTGLDHIDLNIAKKKDVHVISLNGDSRLSSIYSTAELSWALILYICRNLGAAIPKTLSGSWDRSEYCGYQLAGLTLGIVGYGRLGAMVANYGKAFGMKVLVNDILEKRTKHGHQFVSLESLLKKSDIVSIHVPYCTENKNLINKQRLDLMKPEAILINTSRGGILDERYLIEMLKNKRLRGAGLDVLDGEPRCGGRVDYNIAIDYARKNSNLVITPHIGGYTKSSILATEKIIEDIILNNSKYKSIK